MSRLRYVFSRRAVLIATLGAALAGMAAAQSATPTLAAPYYSAEQAMKGLYSHHLPPLARDFKVQAERLVDTAQQHCKGQHPLEALHRQWRIALMSWETLSTPSVGPLVARRSQRQIDFWPTRPALLRRSMDKAPATLDDMERVGTPAKGFPALELLMQQWRAKGQATSPDACRYAELVAQGIAREARELNASLNVEANKDWAHSPEDTQAALAEWVNQWLGGLERLRWAHIEKPITTHRTTGKADTGGPIPFARLDRDTALSDWRAQWRSLLAQARLPREAPPPAAGLALVPMEALLMGKGHLDLAQRWGQALDQITAGLDRLTPRSGEDELMGLAQTMKAATVLFQNEVATALDVPLGFSDADGD